MKPFILLLLISGLFSGCNSTPNRNFTGQTRPALHSTVRSRKSALSDKIYITFINGKDTCAGGRREPTIVDISPGEHKFKLRAECYTNLGGYLGEIQFFAKENIIYNITLERDRSSNQSNGINIFDLWQQNEIPTNTVSKIDFTNRKKEPLKTIFVIRDSEGNFITRSHTAEYIEYPPKYDGTPYPTYIPPIIIQPIPVNKQPTFRPLPPVRPVGNR